MKKVLFALSMVGLMLGTQAMAGNAALFNYDHDEIVAELSDLAELEGVVASSEGMTLSLLTADNELAGTVSFNITDMLETLAMLEPPLGIPSFLWGCVLGWIGILITYLVTDDTEETKKALLGCIIGWGFGCLMYVLIYALILGNAFLFF